MSSYLRRAASAGAFVTAIVIAPVVSEANFSSNACLKGSVEAYDYAELEANLEESFLDRKARLNLVSESAELTLSVTNLDGQNVCENIADLTTSCHWSLGNDQIFVIKIDNTMRATSTDYELCAQ
ncbi:MAG: hypothetical protein R3D57_04750 [Hyphomicrobiaceae bacterium]